MYAAKGGHWKTKTARSSASRASYLGFAKANTLAARAVSVTEADDIESARPARVLTGHRVEALSERSGDFATWVNPNGSLTTDVASGAVRVKENGQCKRIDTTLVDTGSRLEPKTAVAAVELSDGGGEDFASVTRGGHTFGLDWGSTPTDPYIQGDTAVYPAAVPGEDLHVTALPHGFTESLILKKRPTEPVERLPVAMTEMKLGTVLPAAVEQVPPAPSKE